MKEDSVDPKEEFWRWTVFTIQWAPCHAPRFNSLKGMAVETESVFQRCLQHCLLSFKPSYNVALGDRCAREARGWLWGQQSQLGSH